MSKVKEAVECFNKGFNCSQAIFSTYCEPFGLDTDLALKISCGFGAGMGKLGETCGAVSGAYLLIGLKYGNVNQDDSQSKQTTYELIRKFTEKFEQINKTTICRELLGVDLLTGDSDFAAERVKLVCPKMVHDASEIIEEMLEME